MKKDIISELEEIKEKLIIDTNALQSYIHNRISRLQNEINSETSHNNDFKPDCEKCEMEVRYKCKDKSKTDMIKECPYNPS